QAAEVDVGKGELRLGREAPRFGEQRAVLVDERVAVPGEVGGGFALARGAVEIRGEAARRLVRHELVAIAFLADDDVRRRPGSEYRGPCERGVGGGRRRHPQVLADLDVQHEVALLGETEDEIGAERRALSGKLVLAL